MTYKQPRLISSDASITVDYSDVNNIDLTNAGGGGSFDFSGNAVMYEDFSTTNFTVSGGGSQIFNYPWTLWGTSNTTMTSEVSHPGVAEVRSSNDGTAGNLGWITYPGYFLGNGEVTITWILKTDNVSGDGGVTYIWRIGFGETQGAAQVNGTYFEYTDSVNSGNWQIVTSSASTRTTTNTATAMSTGWHKYTITINAAGTSAEFFIDGSSVGTITTNIPTATAVNPMWGRERTNSGGTNRFYYSDLCYVQAQLATPR